MQLQSRVFSLVSGEATSLAIYSDLPCFDRGNNSCIIFGFLQRNCSLERVCSLVSGEATTWLFSDLPCLDSLDMTEKLLNGMLNLKGTGNQLLSTYPMSQNL